MKKFLFLALILLQSCGEDIYSNYPQSPSTQDSTNVWSEPVVRQPDVGMIVIPGNVVFDGYQGKPSKVILEITFTSDSTFTFTNKTTGAAKKK